MGLLDGVLDRSVLFSFDRSGYVRQQKRFDLTDLDRTMEGKICLVTGANSGLGWEVARGLAARNATVHCPYLGSATRSLCSSSMTVFTPRSALDSEEYISPRAIIGWFSAFSLK